jgi:hypothetical protein
MFSVIFEVHPRTEQWDNYLGNAKMLRPELGKSTGSSTMSVTRA